MTVSILDFMEAPEFAGTTFHGDTWTAQKSVLAGAFGVAMTQEQAAQFERLSGGRKPLVGAVVRELWVAAGRRIAKTLSFGAGTAVYLGTVHAEQTGLLDRLAPGETGVIALIAVDRTQTRVAIGYVKGILKASPVLSKMIAKEGADFVELANAVRIEVFTNNFRTVRGRTLLAVVLDECAYFRSDDTANPDREVYRAVLPALATTGGMLIGVSSPYSRRGLLWDKYQKHYGKNGDILVIQGSTLDFNPTIDRRIIEEALEDDPEGAKAEWLGKFRADLEQFLSLEAVQGATREGPLELPRGEHNYFAFTDPAGGGRDEFTIAIGHREESRAVVDLVRGQRGVPAAITAEFAELLKSYGVSQISGDRYAGTWPGDEFYKHGITYRPSDLAKSDLYINALPAFNSGRVEIPDDARLINQLIGLERRTSRSGRDSIDHPPNAHDDRANAVAGLVSRLAKRKQPTACFGTYGISATTGRKGYYMAESSPNRLCGTQTDTGPEQESQMHQLSDGSFIDRRTRTS